jgi:hypothetical protein
LLLFLSMPFAVLPQEREAWRRDLSKSEVELPLEEALTPSLVGAPRKVAPGLVRWHAGFEAACAAARVSGKPVLLFQLLGRLDEEFC